MANEREGGSAADSASPDPELHAAAEAAAQPEGPDSSAAPLADSDRAASRDSLVTPADGEESETPAGPETPADSETSAQSEPIPPRISTKPAIEQAREALQNGSTIGPIRHLPAAIAIVVAAVLFLVGWTLPEEQLQGKFWAFGFGALALVTIPGMRILPMYRLYMARARSGPPEHMEIVQASIQDNDGTQGYGQTLVAASSEGLELLWPDGRDVVFFPRDQIVEVRHLAGTFRSRALVELGRNGVTSRRVIMDVTTRIITQGRNKAPVDNLVYRLADIWGFATPELEVGG